MPAERRAKLQPIVEHTIAQKYQNATAVGELLKKEDVQRGRVERVLTVRQELMTIRLLAMRYDPRR